MPKTTREQRDTWLHGDHVESDKLGWPGSLGELLARIRKGGSVNVSTANPYMKELVQHFDDVIDDLNKLEAVLPKQGNR